MSDRAPVLQPPGHLPDPSLWRGAVGPLLTVALIAAGGTWLHDHPPLFLFEALLGAVAISGWLGGWPAAATSLVVATAFALAESYVIGATAGPVSHPFVFAGTAAVVSAATLLARRSTARRGPVPDVGPDPEPAALPPEVVRDALEVALGESEERYRLLAESIPDVVFTTDAHGRCDYVNGRFYEYTGLEPASGLGLGWLEALHPDEREAIAGVWRTARESGKEFFREYRVRTAEGGWRWYQGHCVPILGEDGNVCRWFGTLTDIDRRKRAEALLRTSEERFRVLCNFAPLAIYMAEPEGRCVYVSPQWQAITGQAPRAALNWGWTELLPEAEREQVLRVWRKRTRQGKRLHREMPVLTPAGECRWVRTVATPLPGGGNGRARPYIGTLEDVTRRKLAEQELRDHRDGLERRVAERTTELRRLYGQLQSVREQEKAALARELHDAVGSELAVLGLDLERLKHRLAQSPELAGQVEAIAGALSAILRSTRQMQTELRPAVLDDMGLAEAIRWQAREFQKHTDIVCEVVCADFVPASGAAIALFRILQESLTNVAKHARASRVRISLRAGRDAIRLTVADNGVGLGEARSCTDAQGIRGMTERAQFLGGRLVVKSTPLGTTVVASVPHSASS